MQRARWFTLLLAILLRGLLLTPLLAAQTREFEGSTQEVLEGTGFGNRTVPLAVNDAAQMIGLAIDTATGAYRTLSWDEDGAILALPAPDGWSAAAVDINNDGVATGMIADMRANDVGAIPAIWTADGMTELPLDGGHGGTAYAINNQDSDSDAVVMCGSTTMDNVRATARLAPCHVKHDRMARGDPPRHRGTALRVTTQNHQRI